jgi:hypothetical protein
MARLSRRTAIPRILAAVAAVPLGLHALAHGNTATALARAAPAGAASDEPAEDADSPPTRQPGYHFFSLAGPGEDGPLTTGTIFNKWKDDLGYATFDGGTFLMHVNNPAESKEWIGSRIGSFSIKDGALMVEARGELNDIGCFGLEMRRQAYTDRRYMRANWLTVDPPTGTLAIGTDGMYGRMVNVATSTGVAAVRPQGEWNTFLFIAQGKHFEGWVNGVKAVQGEDYHYESGRIGLITMRMNREPFQARFRNLQIWDGILPDPTAAWG